MTYSAENIRLIKALSDARGPSGFEDEVLAVVRAALDDICTFEEDKVRNLYIYRQNHSGEKPVLKLVLWSIPSSPTVPCVLWAWVGWTPEVWQPPSCWFER